MYGSVLILYSCITLPVVESVTDLGVTYNNKLKFGPYIDKVCSKASSRAKLILKCFQTRSPSILLKAYCTFVQPILECVCCMEPICDISKIEAVQRHFTKRLGGLGHMSYCQRLSLTISMLLHWNG